LWASEAAELELQIQQDKQIYSSKS
jgi:hypothetical protein